MNFTISANRVLGIREHDGKRYLLVNLGDLTNAEAVELTGAEDGVMKKFVAIGEAIKEAEDYHG
jgi:hypothetical protein